MLLSDYTPDPPPWSHQESAFAFCAQRRYFALAMEQRTGKTKVTIGKAARHYEEGHITALWVVAMPGDVHVNWVTDEVPAHLPPRIPRMCIAWDAGRAHLKGYQRELEALLSFRGLAILTVNGEAVITPTFRRYLARFLKRRERVMAIIDEQTLVIKTPGSKRAKVLLAAARLPEVVVRGVLDGTPVGEGPFDLFAPYQFLKPGLLGHATFTSYRHHFAEYETKVMYDKKADKLREYPSLVSYRNLDELSALMAPHTFRVLRRDCFDLPEKVYVDKHRFELGREQRRVYDALQDEYRAELRDGLPVTAEHVLTRLLRLQQVTSNFWPETKGLAICPACSGDGCEACDDLGALEATFPARRISDENPRLEAFMAQVALSDEPIVVWARFRQDVTDVFEALRAAGRDPVRYDGECSRAEKLEARQAFQAGRASDLVGSARAGGRGLRLTRARSIHYYSNEFPLLVRLQSEDRAEGAAGQERGTGIHDYVGVDTKDEDIVDALRAKRSVADHILHEKSGPWI